MKGLDTMFENKVTDTQTTQKLKLNIVKALIGTVLLLATYLTLPSFTQETVTEDNTSSVTLVTEVPKVDKQSTENIVASQKDLDVVINYMQMLNLPLDIYDMCGIAETETNFTPTTIGGDGEYGMFQVLPETWDYTTEWMKKYYPEHHSMLSHWTDVKTNMLVSVSYIAIIRDELKSNGIDNPSKEMIITAYNRGVNGAIDYFSVGRCLPVYTQKCLINQQKYRDTNNISRLEQHFEE